MLNQRMKLPLFHNAAVILCFLFGLPVSAQQSNDSQAYFHPEAVFINIDRTTFSDQIIIKFEKGISASPIRHTRLSLEDATLLPSNLKSYLESLERSFGDIQLIKRVPNAQEGDTLRFHRITGELVRIMDFSKLYTIYFAQPVPVDSILQQLRQYEEIEYAVPPVKIVSFVDPNDPEYQNPVDRWNLDMILASRAWDITKGSSSIKIAIIDNGPQQDHAEFVDEFGQNKVVGGDSVGPTPGDDEHHGTSVAGLAAGGTNNQSGIASLGWNLRLLTYNRHENTIESLIDDAINDGADIINMSWGVGMATTTICDGKEEDITHPVPDLEDLAPITEALECALDVGIICLAAAGNDAINDLAVGCEDPTAPPVKWYPARYNDIGPADNPGVISISATKDFDQFAEDYNYDPDGIQPYYIDFAAPGWQVKIILYRAHFIQGCNYLVLLV